VRNATGSADFFRPKLTFRVQGHLLYQLMWRDLRLEDSWVPELLRETSNVRDISLQPNLPPHAFYSDIMTSSLRLDPTDPDPQKPRLKNKRRERV
jgi:hypothetical protein